jgi:hypothetical protein
MKIGKNRFQCLVQKKCGVCFDGAYATKKNSAQMTHPATVVVGHGVLRKPGTSNCVN